MICCQKCKHFKDEPYESENGYIYDGICRESACECLVFDCRIDVCSRFEETPIQWIKDGDYISCPNCGTILDGVLICYKYCPMCGKPMKGEDYEELQE